VCGQQHVSPPFIPSKSRMRKSARTDLRGGRSAMIVPTASTERLTHDFAVCFLSEWLPLLIVPEQLRMGNLGTSL
jgi:hypothetical protein